MKTLNELYRNLEKYKDFDENDENCIKFLETVDEIVLRKDPSSIPVLLSYFDDESEYSWVLTSVKKALEYYESSVYVNEYIKNFNIMFPRAIEWACEILYTVLNTSECLEILRIHMHLADRDSLLKLFELMEKESPHHAPLIQELRRELSN
jgi:hypothetical protein